MELHPDFLTRPLAHRGLHDLEMKRPENSRAAVQAAVDAGYGIEIDLQLSSDGEAIVFHDYGLGRLTTVTGPVRQRSAAELRATHLIGGSETIPTLSDILSLVAGRAPLLVELKDQDGALGPNVGLLEQAVAQASATYDGPLAFMSFNPHSMIALRKLAPDLVRGLTTSGFAAEIWPMVPFATRKRLAGIPDLDAAGACFVSHDTRDLASPRIAELKANGLPILCWTIRSAEADAMARRICDNVTFEGYAAA